MPLPKKYREKYPVKLKTEEKVANLSFKVVGMVVFFLTVALALDIYNLIH